MTCEVQCDTFLLTDEKVMELLAVTCEETNVPEAHVTVRCVFLEEIQRLNSVYRNNEKPTNILTFSYPETKEHDVAVCMEVAEQEATILNVSTREYLALLLVHAFLHVAGMDHELSHEEESRTVLLEKRILARCGFESMSLLTL